MSKNVIIVLALALFSSGLVAQVDSTIVSGIEVITPVKVKGTRTNFYLSGGLQSKGWFAVPMVPESIDPELLRNGNELAASGWFAGIGASKPTDLHLEFGIMLNYFSSSVPIAFEGERSTGDWVLEQSGSLYTDPFAYQVDRINNVFSIRTFARYNVNFKPFNYWVALYAGTFSSSITYKGVGQEVPEGTFNTTSLGVNGQTGLDFIVYDKMGRARFSISLFADFMSPLVSESIFSLIEDNWVYRPGEKTNAISPLRFGLMLGFH